LGYAGKASDIRSGSMTPLLEAIVKHVPPASAADAQRVRGFQHDWAGAEFLASLELDPPLGPRFYGGDVEQVFFVIKDLGQHRSLVQPLLEGSAAEAEAGLLKYAAALGRLHAATIGRAADFEALFAARFAGQRPFVEELDDLDARHQKVAALLDGLGVRPRAGVAQEIAAVIEASADPGPFLAYLHSDPCPDNLFDEGDRFRLIDFEYGHFGHVLLDGLYPRLQWPSCWCIGALPPKVLAHYEDRYRAELARGCSQAQDDALWERALAQMFAQTVLNRIAWDLEYALREERTWGRSTVRQRMLSRLEGFVTTAHSLGQLPALRGLMEQVFAVLHARWPDTPPMPVYPAFDSER